MNLGSLRTPQLTVTAPHTVLAVPLGATEQHGPHLPLNTDTTIAVELCRRLAQRLATVRVAPAIPYGSSGEHAGFPGTLSIGQDALRLVITELVRSADAFAGVVLVNGHGGNRQPLRQARTIDVTKRADWPQLRRDTHAIRTGQLPIDAAGHLVPDTVT